MRLNEFAHDDLALVELLDEGPIADKWKKLALGGAVAAGLAAPDFPSVTPADAALDFDTSARIERLIGDLQGQKQISPSDRAELGRLLTGQKYLSDRDRAELDRLIKSVSAEPSREPAAMPQANVEREQMLTRAATKAGLKGKELAAFLAQTSHESMGFNNMNEVGSTDYFRKKYDPEYAPKTAAILGNTRPGDGVRYFGRGFIQLTGRDNYKMAGDALNLPLLQKPELAARPDLAAKIALWYWKTRVRPNVTDFSDVEAVTQWINPALKNLETRKQAYRTYASLKENINTPV